MQPTVYSGSFDLPELRHLLRRTLFGVKLSDLDFFSDMSLEEAVDHLLREIDLPEPPVNNYDIEVSDPEVPKGELFVEKRATWAIEELDDAARGAITSGRLNSLRAWMIKFSLNQERSVHFKMFQFWSNHFGANTGQAFMIKTAYDYYKLLWNFSFGNFYDLIRAITINPNMLIFLNGTDNIKDAPDENFARELQELFCIGKGPEAAYTEEDVQKAARVLTGWGINWDSMNVDGPPESAFFEWNHESSSKRFSEFYNNTQIVGKAGDRGAEELDDLLEMIVYHPECPKFICRKIHNFFLHSDIDEETETNFILPLAQHFVESGYNIKELLRAFFMSDHFFDKRWRGALIKSPMDVMLGFWRTNDVVYPADGDPLDEDYYTHLMMYYYMYDMGFGFGEPPSVAGWPAYHQTPSYDRLWITTYTLISRIVISDSFTNGYGLWTPLRGIKWDYLAHTRTIPEAHDPNLLIDYLEEMHFAVELNGPIRWVLKNILLSGQATDGYWTDAWNAYVNDPNNKEYEAIVNSRLQYFYTYLFQLPEYQLI